MGNGPSRETTYRNSLIRHRAGTGDEGLATSRSTGSTVRGRPRRPESHATGPSHSPAGPCSGGFFHLLFGVWDYCEDVVDVPEEKPVVARPSRGDNQLPEPNVLKDALASDEEEIRQQIASGAGTTEEIRALAERLRAHRKSESVVWASEVKPQLIKARKARFRRSTLATELEVNASSQRNVGLIVVVMVLLLVGAVSNLDLSIMFLLVPLLAFIGYAGWIGSRASATPEPEDHDGPTD